MEFVAGGMYRLIRTWLAGRARETPQTMAALTFMLLYDGFSPLHSSSAGDDEPLRQAKAILARPTR
ncbi:MAG: hypothetical protein AAGD35_10320 [Actinomycetota bacterium]